MIIRKLDLRQIIIERLDQITDSKLKKLKVDTLYFDEKIGDIEGVQHKYGYKTFIRQNGYKVTHYGLTSKQMINLINQLKENKCFSYRYIDTIRYKVRPK